MTQAGPGRPPRSLRRSFAGMVLVGELFVAGFAALAANTVTDVPGRQVLVGWLVLSVLCLLATAMLRSPVGYGIGWFVQVLLVVSGHWVTMMWFIGFVLALTWVVLLVQGGRADAVTRQRQVAEARWRAEHPGGA